VTTTNNHNGSRQEAPRPIWTLVLASMGLFMTALDTLVVTTALPVLRVSLHTTLSDLEWTVNAYNLAFACSLLTGAALGDRFGRRRVFCIGLSVFTLASVGSALAPTVGVLIATRALQGVGAAMVFPLSLTLISEAFPAEQRGIAIGVWGGIAGLAVAAGPVVGGAVVEGINWHWIFWLNVPIGLVLVPLAASKLSESYGPRPRLDLVGLVLAGAGFFGLTWGLVRANAVGWSSGEVVAALLGGAALVGVFLWWEHRAPSPMLSLALFRRARFTSANAVSFFMYAGLFGAVFLMSQFFQTAQHHSPLQTGVRLLPWTAAPMVVSPIAGKLAERYGNRPFMAVGLALQTVGLAWIAAIATAGIGFGALGVALGVAGVGIGMVFPTVSTEVLAAVPPEEVGVASGTNSALRELGGVFGVAVLASVFSRPGVYTSPALFVEGFSAALWVGAGFPAAGVLAAVAVRGRAPRREELAPDESPALAEALR
jgi:EmrB/QacA subfamily drug resistance transporter